MGRILTPVERAYMNGEASYPNRRIGYPDAPGAEEDAWLAGFNSAKYECTVELDDAVGNGRDTFLWGYRAAYC